MAVKTLQPRRLKPPPHVVPIIALVCLLAATACGRTSNSKATPTLVERSRVSMGTAVHISAWTTDETATVKALDKAFDEFDRLDALMSTWKEGSDITRLNDAAGKSAVSVSADVREVLHASQEVSEWTGGKFDVTFAALSGLWKFDHDIDGQVPDRSQIAPRLPLIDYRALAIDDRAGTASLTRAGMRVNLGGIGKGYAVDRAATILRDAGLSDFMIQSGGDLFAAGKRGDRPWRVGVQDPRGEPNTLFAALEITDAAFSTSGDYERYFMRDGHRYHHILDPDTGEPASRSRSVSILARSATVSDGLSTGVFILGGEEGMALIEKLPNVEGVIVTAENRVLVSSGLKGRLAQLKAPSE
ncbi:MAG TPA: FAD:protein FMN transferase [Vicinamibacterales bacterium]|nr:FAD:protein FMN transferase [Vicinamibacterales bacterium]